MSQLQYHPYSKNPPTICDASSKKAKGNPASSKGGKLCQIDDVLWNDVNNNGIIAMPSDTLIIFLGMLLNKNTLRCFHTHQLTKAGSTL